MKTSSIAIALTFLLATLATAGDTWRSGKSHISSGKAPVARGKSPIVDSKAPVGGPCLSYDFIDLNYGILDYYDGSSYGFNFSKSLGSSLFLTGGYNNAGFDYLFGAQRFDIESHQYSLGLGTHYALSECVDFTLEGGVTHHDNTFQAGGFPSYDSWGYYVGPGLRARSGRLEGYAKVFYVGREGVPVYGLDSEGFVFKPGLLYHLTDNLALKVAADWGESSSAVIFGARIQF